MSRPASARARHRARSPARSCCTSSATRPTLFFALFIPVLELFMLGYAIDTNVRHVRTVVFDQAGTQESRRSAPAVRELARTSRIVGDGLHRRTS